MPAALVIQHAKRMRLIILPSATCPALPQSSTARFSGKNYWNKTCFDFLYNLWPKQGRASTQALRCRPLATDERVPFRASSGGICGGQNSTWTGFSPSTSLSPVSFTPPIFNIHQSVYHQCFTFLAIHNIQPTKRTTFFLTYLYYNITLKYGAEEYIRT